MTIRDEPLAYEVSRDGAVIAGAWATGDGWIAGTLEPIAIHRHQRRADAVRAVRVSLERLH